MNQIKELDQEMLYYFRFTIMQPFPQELKVSFFSTIRIILIIHQQIYKKPPSIWALVAEHKFHMCEVLG